MKIILVVPSLSGGGVERIVSRFSLEFERLGHRVKVVLLVNKVEYPHGGSILLLKSKPSSNYIFKLYNLFIRAFQLKKIFQKEKPELIYAFMESCTYASILTGFNVIVSVQNNMDTRLNRYQKRIMSFFYNFSNVKKVVAVSDGIERALHKNNIHNTVKIYNPFIFKKNITITEDLSRYQPYILTVGRLDSIKNFKMLIISYLNSKTFINAKLLIVGEGEERGNLEILIKEFNLQDRVFLIGRKLNVDDYYLQSDIFILSSLSEGFPSVLIEALSNKCPVISTDCPTGPSEIINHKNGILVANNNQNEMTKAIDSLFYNKKLKNFFKTNAVDTIRHLDSEIISKQWLEL